MHMHILQLCSSYTGASGSGLAGSYLIGMTDTCPVHLSGAAAVSHTARQESVSAMTAINDCYVYD